jgi:hypothetical protein
MKVLTWAFEIRKIEKNPFRKLSFPYLAKPNEAAIE